MPKTVLGVVRNARENTWDVFSSPLQLSLQFIWGQKTLRKQLKPQLYQAGNWEPGHQGPIFNSAPSQLCVILEKSCPSWGFNILSSNLDMSHTYTCLFEQRLQITEPGKVGFLRS